MVFDAIRNSTAKILILQGGTSSSKTVSALQDCIVYSIYNKGKVTTITGESIPNLKKGAYRDTEWLYSISDYFRSQVKFWNKSDRIIYFKNGSVIEFISNQDEQGAKAGKRDRLFADEANGISWNIFFQMAIRTREKVMVAYNPSAKFWAHSKLIGTKSNENDLSAEVELMISDHRHNCFLTEDEHNKIEGIKDPKKWKVYARGMTGELDGMIFNFNKINEIPTTKDEHGNDVSLPFGFGIDFGYNADKTSVVKTYWDNNKRYHHELLYEVGVDTEKIAAILKENGCTTATYVWGDHDKTASVYLRRLNIPFRMARKGPNSLVASISKVNEYDNFYYDSPNLEKELETYLWAKGTDLLTGNEVSLGVPVEGFDDHSCAAIRYFCYSHSLRNVK